jgi:hypothetical protein
MEPWRALDAQNVGVKAQNGAVWLGMSVFTDSHQFDEKQDPDPQ